MLSALGFIFQVVSSVIFLVQTVKSLITNKRPETSFRPYSSRPIKLWEHSPIIEPEKEKTMIEFQIEIEKLFHKNQLMPRLRAEFSNEPEIIELIKNAGLEEDFGIDLLVQISLHKRAKLSVLVGCLRKHFDGDCQKTADALLTAAEHDLVNWSTVTREFIVIYGISPDVQAEIDRYQYPLPMVVEPKELKTNHDSAYYTGSGSVILRDNHHEEDVCLDHLNAMNKIKLRINQDVALTVKNKWKNLDKVKDDEEIEDYRKRVKAFEKYNKTAHDVINHLGLAQEGEFYLTHRYDKRGRTYSQGYHVNYQGAPWNKAVIELANQEVVE